MNCVIIEYLN
uniref:Uncharacterized protein n=1 Tax=Phaseolus vulgaris TaxID=3885 RepID=V7CQJ4_PHAVU|nr:hypothetical protein PHAVU_002G3259001g [Phaseolus vulgaris]XP_007160484.1 hypothetical protein PHAVU_002G3259001g [Phaseolus vulgaris]XP_007160485.1 hypothetical protein PHAVU_002G3259001g [Phaseolus vulgaris]ESW32477.1 hypothetical protein PHAVU_002G3259001g [Phaseolus vulgaris]ESW32478.1 hypothetical protein PHAVU_002G3259001g [Phaseolus vulgaris]ESW32479.1 hypothetical protein PHAVU_002G3259001g [Phaseolus vulgaris]